MSEREGGWLVKDDEQCPKCMDWMANYGVQVFYCRADENRTVPQIKECFDAAEEKHKRIAARPNDIPFTEEDFADG
jgi:hypothetical protein